MQKISTWVWFILGVALVGMGGAFFMNATPTKKNGLRDAPKFSLQDSDGKKASLSDFKDQVVVVHFWASWCGPCIPEIPEVLSAAARTAADSSGRPIHWLIVSVDDSWEKIRKVLDVTKLPKNTLALIDPESKLSDRFGTYQYPETYVLNREHEVAAKWIGPQERSGAWGKQALQGLQQLSLTGQAQARKN